MTDILIRLDAAEALIALSALEDKALDASRLAAISSGDEHEIADLSAKILRRVATRLTDALYPDTCRWLDDEACDFPMVSEGLCRVHLSHRLRVAEILA